MNAVYRGASQTTAIRIMQIHNYRNSRAHPPFLHESWEPCDGHLPEDSDWWPWDEDRAGIPSLPRGKCFSSWRHYSREGRTVLGLSAVASPASDISLSCSGTRPGDKGKTSRISGPLKLLHGCGTRWRSHNSPDWVWPIVNYVTTS